MVKEITMDSFDDLQIEDTPGYEAYQAQLELEQYLESDEFREELNLEIQEICQRERESVDFII
jgi:hypothetical protein